MEAKHLTHLNSDGEARMVDVGGKADTHRAAEARGTVRLSREAYDAIVAGNLKKGDALGRPASPASWLPSAPAT